MSQLFIFTPQYGKGITVLPSATSASTTVPAVKGKKQFVVTNTGTEICYIRPSIGGSTATAADYPLLPNTQLTLTKDQEADTFDYVTLSGSGELHIIAGEGF